MQIKNVQNRTERNTQKIKINAHNNQLRSLYSLLTRRDVTLHNRRYQMKATDQTLHLCHLNLGGGERGGGRGGWVVVGYRVGCTLQRLALNTFLLREERSYSSALLHVPCGYDGLSQTKVLRTRRVCSGQHTSHATQIICAASILNP